MGWKGDGVIAEIYSQEEETILRDLGIPFVNTSSYQSEHAMHTICPDNREIGRMAARELLKSDLDNFAFAGSPHLAHSMARYQGFLDHLKSRDAQCDHSLMDAFAKAKRNPGASIESVSPKVFVNALRNLKLPVGILAASDRIGISILLACRELGLRSPDDVALISVDNDKIFTQLSFVGMTSIMPNSWAIGYEAAKLLKRLIDGESIEPKQIKIPPKGIVQRDSTDPIRSRYKEVAYALRFVRNHHQENIDVSSLLEVLPVSRRWLENKFREEVGHGISQEIRRVRIERAKALLTTTNQSLDQIARECGFNSVVRFNFAFQKLLGTNATDYRKNHPADV